jgi:hypothetical protein
MVIEFRLVLHSYFLEELKIKIWWFCSRYVGHSYLAMTFKCGRDERIKQDHLAKHLAIK